MLKLHEKQEKLRKIGEKNWRSVENGCTSMEDEGKRFRENSLEIMHKKTKEVICK